MHEQVQHNNTDLRVWALVVSTKAFAYDGPGRRMCVALTLCEPAWPKLRQHSNPSMPVLRGAFDRTPSLFLCVPDHDAMAAGQEETRLHIGTLTISGAGLGCVWSHVCMDLSTDSKMPRKGRLWQNPEFAWMWMREHGWVGYGSRSIPTFPGGVLPYKNDVAQAYSS